jgi:hypothetical protein
MADNGPGVLQIGVNSAHEVVLNLPHGMTGHIVFSPTEARGLADTLIRKAIDAEAAHRAEREAQRIANVPPVDRSKQCTTSGEPVAKVRAEQTEETGQHKGYIVLCPDERAKGFVRPYRDRYQHVGRKPKYPLVDLTPEQHERYDPFGYVKFEPFPDGSEESNGGTSSGRYWTQKDLDGGCGSVTTMGRALSETYARDPKFYGSTFCVTCNKHLPVGEFVWTADGQVVGS